MGKDRLGAVLDGDIHMAEAGVELESAKQMAQMLKRRLQNPPPGVVPLQGPSGVAGLMKSLFQLLISDHFFLDESVIVCFTDRDGNSLMAIGLKKDAQYWKSPEVAQYYQFREPVRTYEFLEYATMWLNGLPKQSESKN